MSGATELRVRRGVQWSPALSEEYLAGAAPSAEACNSALIEVCAVADRLIAGTLLMTADHAAYETRELPAEAGAPAQPEVGRYMTAGALSGDLRPMTDARRTALRAVGQTDEMIDFTERRMTTALALMQVGREMGQSSAAGVGAPSRGAGWVQIAAIAGVAALVGLAVDWYCAHRSRADQATRVRQAGIVTAGRATTERLRVFAETGTMPPETEIERAAAESIRGAAAQAREAGLGQQIGTAVAETVSGLGKVAAAIAVVFVGVELMRSSRSGS